jgi:hypothetical protein
MTYELTESKKVLESIVRKEVVSFCYPWGLYNTKVTEKVKESGYKLARTTKSLQTMLSRPLNYHPTIHVFDYNLIAKSKHIVTAGDRSLATKLLLYGNIFKSWDMIAKKSLDHVLENGGIWFFGATLGRLIATIIGLFCATYLNTQRSMAENMVQNLLQMACLLVTNSLYIYTISNVKLCQVTTLY